MTRNDSFRRKIIYICAIALLLLPLSFISQPATVKKGPGESTAGESTGGGLLAQLRKKHQLSQAEISEIDPASESMKLATLGLRPVAVTLLWNQIQDAKKKHQWDRLRTATQTLIALQPNFIRVWEFQAHNLSYNISREFDDFQYRYHWVKEGLSYLMTGIAYNRKDHRIFDNLGFFFGLKLGRSDEKVQFRRLFRRDIDFHAKMSEYGIDPIKIHSPELGGPDNWLAAYEWYDRSRFSVDNRNIRLRTSGLMFYKNAPSQLRNYAVDYEEEKRPDDAAQVAWTKALEEWSGDDFGRKLILTSTNLPVYLDRIADERERLRKLQKRIDTFAPTVREELKKAREATVTEEMWKAYNTPLEQSADEKQLNLHLAAKAILEVDEDVVVRAEIARRLETEELSFTDEQRLEYDRVLSEIGEVRRSLSFVNKYRGTVNYEYWKDRCDAESRDITIEARKALFDARALSSLAKIDEQEVKIEKKDKDGNFVLDQNGNRVIETVMQPGAIQKYLESFRLWKEVFKDFETLEDDVLEDDLITAMKEYYSNLRKIREEWPLDFPLQPLLDRRQRSRIDDGLPTSKSMADRIEAAKEEAALKKELEGTVPKNDPQNQDTKGKEGEKTKPKQDEKADPKKSEPKKSEPKKTEPKKTEPKKTEPKKTDPKKTEPEKTEPEKTAKPKAAEPKKSVDNPGKKEPSKSNADPKKN